MSKDLQNKTSEEIDLGQVFNAIGKLFDRFFKFIGSIFKGIFSFFIYFLKTIIDNLLIVCIVVGAAFLIGYFIEKRKPTVYEANMLVKPYFDSKYQLVTNVKYFNSLLSEGNHDVLSDIFEIPNDDAKKLLSFKVETGPETKNELLKQYDGYLKSLDSSRAQTITYNDFVENRDIYSSEIYLVTVKSLKKDIFRNLEVGFDSTFSNKHSIDQKFKRDKTLDLKKEAFLKNISKIDSLQAIYLEVVKTESEKGDAFVNVQGLLPLQQEKTKTYEYELLHNEVRIRDSIRALDQLKVEENTYYDVLSRFPEVGNESSSFTSKYYVVFPIAAFILLCISYLGFKVFKFVKNYEN